MYMAPITAVKTPASATTRRLTGLIVLPVSAIVMVPFLAAYAVYATVMLGLRGIAGVPRTVLQMIDYAGQVALGR